MEERRDLQKFTTGAVVAQRRDTLSSSREARGDIDRRRARTQQPAVRPARWERAVRRNAVATNRRIDDVKHLTPRWGIESFAKLNSDQTAAEALQEAETEVGLGVMAGSGARGAVQVLGSSYRSVTRIDAGLTARKSAGSSCAHAGESMQLVEGWRSWELRWRK